ncbi:MAG TPA: hypothetical protein VHB74_03170 [Devosia sp.]|nr:hypothetical protein [Devosia sp.]
MAQPDLMKPDFARNIRLLGHSDQGGRADGVQIMVVDGFAYVGHQFSDGFSVIDVRDPRNPKTVNYIPSPPNTWSIHLQAADDLLLVINCLNFYREEHLTNEAVYYSGSMAEKTQGSRGYSAGIRVYDIKDRANPREVGFMPVDGVGVHRIWYTGGRWAYASALLDGFIDAVMIIVDMADPTHPKMVSTNWIPGMNKAAGEVPSWDPKFRYSCHHPIVAGDTAYVTWRDGGLTLVDVSDRYHPRTISHRNWCPPYGGGTHNALPLPDRDLVIVVDEAVRDEIADGIKYIWTFDVRDKTNPVSISTMPTPAEIDYAHKGAHFGPHNIHENRPGSFVSSTRIFTTYQNAGVRVFDIANAYEPKEIGALVPPEPARLMDTRPNRAKVIQTSDIFVDRNQIMYVTDTNAGLYIMEMTE